MEYFLTHCVSRPSLLHSRTPSDCESTTIPHKHLLKASGIFFGMHFCLEWPVSSNGISSTTMWVLFAAITALLTVQPVWTAPSIPFNWTEPHATGPHQSSCCTPTDSNWSRLRPIETGWVLGLNHFLPYLIAIYWLIICISNKVIPLCGHGLILVKETTTWCCHFIIWLPRHRERRRGTWFQCNNVLRGGGTGENSPKHGWRRNVVIIRMMTNNNRCCCSVCCLVATSPRAATWHLVPLLITDWGGGMHCENSPRPVDWKRQTSSFRIVFIVCCGCGLLFGLLSGSHIAKSGNVAPGSTVNNKLGRGDVLWELT